MERSVYAIRNRYDDILLTHFVAIKLSHVKLIPVSAACIRHISINNKKVAHLNITDISDDVLQFVFVFSTFFLHIFGSKMDLKDNDCNARKKKECKSR